MALVPLHLRWQPVGEAFKRDGKPRRVGNGLKNPPRAGGAAALPFPFVPSLLGGFLRVHAAVSWGECSRAGPIPVYFKTRKETQSRHAAVVCPPLAKSGRGPVRPETQMETARVGGPELGLGCPARHPRQPGGLPVGPGTSAPTAKPAWPPILLSPQVCRPRLGLQL